MSNKVAENFLKYCAFGMILSGCQSATQLESSFNGDYLKDSADLVFYSPNFSAPNMPPLMVGYAYVETYEKSNFCGDDKKYIGKTVITRSQKVQNSKIPSGQVVANIGYYAVGAGGLTGNLYYSFNVTPGAHYKITLTEARPLVTSFSVTVEEIDQISKNTNRLDVVAGKKNICE
jgi:hypothetical protein